MDAQEKQTAKIERLKKTRDNERVAKALEAMKAAARNNENLGETVIEACKAYATLGEMCGALKEVYGEYEPMKIY